MLAQYAGIGQTCPLFSITTISGGNLTAGTLYFSFQLQNRAGFNKPSTSEAITYSANQKIRITIPTMPAGWDIHYFIISAGSTADASTHVQIARVAAYQFGAGIEPQSTKVSLPTTLELTQDDHLALAPSVTSLGSLPTNPLDGQVRWVTAEVKWYEYRADSTLAEILGNTDIYNPNSSVYGRWVRIGGPSTYVSDTRAGNGSDRPITSINPVTTIPTPPYPGDVGNSKFLPAWSAAYWLYNNDTYVLPSGIQFGIELEYNNERSPDLLNGLFLVRFLGYVQADGTIRTQDADGRNFPNTDGYFLWSPRLTTPFITPDDLQPGEAIALLVKPFFSTAELNNEITAKSVIGILPSFRTQSGDYNPLGKLLTKEGESTGIIYYVGDRYRVVPNSGLSFDILSGCAIVGGYDFPQKPRRTFSGLQPSTDGQKVVINGSAAVYVESLTYAPTSSEAIRAIVGTLGGTSITGSWSSYVSIGGGATLTFSYPCDADGFGKVRSDYPDVIAGNNKGLFNPFGVNIYLQRQDTLEIRRFSGFNVVPAPTQQFSITDWSQGVTINALPTAAANFSLFLAGVGAISSNGIGNFPATSYRVSYSFVYDGNQITSISHASPPCAYEWPGDFQPANLQVNPVITILDEGESPTVVNSGSGNQAYLTFKFPPFSGGGGGGSGFDSDAILTDSNGQILVDSNGNVLTD